jgi:hypothetical protein
MTDKEKEAKFKAYGSSSENNFSIIGDIGVPHPYCISDKHLLHNTSMYLGREQIIRMEESTKNLTLRKRAICDICKNIKLKHKYNYKILSFDEHKQALAVECKKEPVKNSKAHEELKQYLLSKKDKCEKDGYVGFTLIKSW